MDNLVILADYSVLSPPFGLVCICLFGWELSDADFNVLIFIGIIIFVFYRM